MEIDAPPEGPITILFADVDGASRLRATHTDGMAGEILRAHEKIVRVEIQRHAGREVEHTGDGFMVTFTSVRRALTAAVDIQRALEAHRQQNPDQAVRVRIGLNTGEVVEQEGHPFGEAVDAAARIMSAATAGQIIASRVVKDLAGTIPGIGFEDRGTVPLRGFPEPWHLYRVTWGRDERPLVSIRLLGELDMRAGGQRLPVPDAPRLQSLLAYLLLHRDAPQPRHHLAFRLWPDSTEAQARTNLRQLLHNLRRALPEHTSLLDVGTQNIQWRPDGRFWLDVAAFDAAAERAEREDEDALASLEKAVSHYGGDLLPSCYDEWILPERERLRQRFIGCLECLTTMLEERGDFGRGIRYAETLLRHDPLHEGTYRRLMRLHARSGDRARALRVYHTCVTVLERELGVEPSPATRDAYRALLAGDAGDTGPAETARAVPGGASATSTLTGRASEWERALQAWREASAGRAQMLLVTGDPGVGKSRLVEELATARARDGIPVAGARSYATEGRLAYAPVIAWLRSDGLRPRLARLDPVWLSAIARLLPEIAVDHPELPRSEPLNESRQRQRLFEALARAILAGEGPVLLVADDLQWTDPETLEFVHYLIRSEQGSRLLIAGTARQEEVDPEHALMTLLAGLRSIERIVEIPLEPLAPGDTASLARQLSDDDLDPATTERLYAETEGNPLFLVETLRAGMPRDPGGDRPADTGVALPPKVHAVIQARLARLSPDAAALAGVAAIVGRDFTLPIVAAAADHDEERLVRALDELWHRRIIREQGTEAYDFSHDKIREVAEAQLGPARRRQLHLAVARALEDAHASDLSEVAAQLAAHHERAGNPARALKYYRMAADTAQRVFASTEIVTLLTKARRLLETLPEGRDRDETELDVLIALGVALVAVRGYGATEAAEVYERAREVSAGLGRAPSGPILRGLALWALVLLNLDRSSALGRDLLVAAERDRDPILTVEARYVLGVSAFWLGDLAASQANLEKAIAAYRSTDHLAFVSQFAQDPKVICTCRLAFTLWHRGDIDRALALQDESIVLAERLGHPFSRGYALIWDAWLASELRDMNRVRASAEAAAELSSDERLAFWAAGADVMLGWCDVHDGEVRRGIQQIRSGIEAYAMIGNLVQTTYALALLARAHGIAGNVEAGLAVWEETFRMTMEKQQRYLEPELHRVRGELLALSGRDPVEVEGSFRTAISVAQGQGAHSRELQAALSLARWRADAGSDTERSDARKTLQLAVGRFPSHLRTADLVEARELIGRTR